MVRLRRVLFEAVDLFLQRLSLGSRVVVFVLEVFVFLLDIVSLGNELVASCFSCFYFQERYSSDLGLVISPLVEVIEVIFKPDVLLLSLCKL